MPQKRILVISPPDFREGEHKKVEALFGAGMERYHLRKPGASVQELHDWVVKLPAKYHDQITVHGPMTLAIGLKVGGVHLREADRAGLGRTELSALANLARAEGLMISASVHEGDHLADLQGFDYAFLSPVFDSISKPGRLGVYESGVLPGDDPDDPVGEPGHPLVGKSAIDTSVDGVLHKMIETPREDLFLPAADDRSARPCPVIALGGIDPEHLPKAVELGFDGVAVLGAIWDRGEDPVDAYKRLLKAWESAVIG